MNKYSTLQNCTFVKTMLMLIVILGHSIAFWTGSWISITPTFHASILDYGYKWINSFHIYAFALVSGYIYAAKRCGGGV